MAKKMYHKMNIHMTSSAYILKKVSIQKVIREISESINPNICWKVKATEALQEAAEHCLINFFAGMCFSNTSLKQIQ